MSWYARKKRAGCFYIFYLFFFQILCKLLHFRFSAIRQLVCSREAFITRHDTKPFSALLALREGNPSVLFCDEFPSQRITNAGLWCFSVVKRWSKTPFRSYDVIVIWFNCSLTHHPLTHSLARSLRTNPQFSRTVYYVLVQATTAKCNMMTSSNGNIFRVAGPLWGECTGHLWIPLTTASDAELWCFLWSTPKHGSVNTRDAGDLRRHLTHYDVTVM